jgi:hypothetical protein
MTTFIKLTIMKLFPQILLFIIEFVFSLIKTALMFIGLFVVLTNTIVGVEQKNVFFPLIDTQFTSQFSFDKWDKIKPKQSKQKVIETLGEPFSITDLTKSNDCFSNPYQAVSRMEYSHDGACKFTDFAWCAYEVFLDKDMNVINKAETWCED